ncbi:MAG: arylsulfatase [Candidatus Sumerlaeota bacterium]|nr:arylsulfatase [Candidatus Sumerlaeota bacterium]
MHEITRRKFIAAAAGAGGLMLLPRFNWAQPPAAGGAARPNIVIILVDDMGFADIGCYGSEIPTPNLDQLAAGGLRFTQFYNTARCCPTRASLLTGLYPHQAGVGHMTEDKNEPGYQGHLNNRCVTIAEVMRNAGYFTAMSGKWHVGQNFGVVPWERGFMRSLNAPAGGFYYGASNRAKLFLNGKELDLADPALPKDWYSTDLWTDYSIKFVDEALAAKQPFFLYLAHNAPNFPLQAPQEEIAKFRGKYKIGWDKLREQRHAKQIELGIMDKAWPMSPRPPEVAAWDSLSAEEKDHFDHIMAIYAAVVAHMDTAVGRFVSALKQRNALDNTLILFLSDNGGNAESGPKGRLEGKTPGDAQSTVFEGESWATLSNTPLRRYKHFAHEGGISTPLIAHWPSQIKRRGELESQPGHLVDLMATCADLGGAKYPTEVNGVAIQPMEGCSLAPAFQSKPINRKAPLFWEHEGNRAIRSGKWKLVAKGPQGEWELYDLEKDRTELRDLAAQMPDKVKEMTAMWEEFARRTNAIPWPWGKPYGEAKAAGAKAKGAGAKEKTAEAPGQAAGANAQAAGGKDKPAGVNAQAGGAASKPGKRKKANSPKAEEIK